MENEIICMSTDGYYDQFGGIDGGKMKRRRFKELLETLSKKQITEQILLIKNYFENWKGQEEQVDDVLVLWFNVTNDVN